MAEGTPLEQIERSLAALEAYSEMWVLDLQESTTEDLEREDYMMHKDSSGNSTWLRLIQIRSTLLLARAIESQNENTKPSVTAEQRLLAAKEALVKTGYFKPEEVGDDIAPRILEMWFNKEDPHD